MPTTLGGHRKSPYFRPFRTDRPLLLDISPKPLNITYVRRCTAICLTDWAIGNFSFYCCDGNYIFPINATKFVLNNFLMCLTLFATFFVFFSSRVIIIALLNLLSLVSLLTAYGITITCHLKMVRLNTWFTTSIISLTH